MKMLKLLILVLIVFSMASCEGHKYEYEVSPRPFIVVAVKREMPAGGVLGHTNAVLVYRDAKGVEHTDPYSSWAEAMCETVNIGDTIK